MMSNDVETQVQAATTTTERPRPKRPPTLASAVVAPPVPVARVAFVRVFCPRRWLGSLPAMVTASYPGDLVDVVVFGSNDVPWETYKLERLHVVPVPHDPGDINANGGEPWAVAARLLEE